MDYRWRIIRGKVVVRRSEKRKVKSEEFKFVLQFKAVYQPFAINGNLNSSLFTFNSSLN